MAQWTQPDSGGNISNTNTGNVGVGTPAPAGKLDVKGGTSDSSASSLSVKNASDASLLFVRNDGMVGFGTKTPASNLHVMTTWNGADRGFMLDQVSSDQLSPQLIFRKSRGTPAVPAAPLAGDSLGTLVFRGYDGAAYTTARTRVRSAAAENWTPTAQGSSLEFSTTPLGSTAIAERLRIDPAGNVGVGTASPSERLHIAGGNLSAVRNEMSLWLANNVANGETNWAQNAYYSSGWKYRLGDEASRIQMMDGKVLFSSAAAGAADAPLTWVNNVTILRNGMVGIGKPNPAEALDVVGNIAATGNIAAKYQDVAEWVPSTQKLAAGTVVVLDAGRTNHVLASTKAYDTAVAGVISDSPGVILGEGGEGKLKVATTGRAKVKVDATRAAIKVGDLLVTSAVEGVAMKSVPVDLGGVAIHRPGTIVGKALEPLDKGVGEVLVLLSLQ